MEFPPIAIDALPLLDTAAGLYGSTADGSVFDIAVTIATVGCNCPRADAVYCLCVGPDRTPCRARTGHPARRCDGRRRSAPRSSRRRRRDAARWGTIASRPTLTPPKALLRCAIRLTDNARDIADHMAVSHPVPRTRASAIAALAAVADDKGANGGARARPARRRFAGQGRLRTMADALTLSDQTPGRLSISGAPARQGPSFAPRVRKWSDARCAATAASSS